MNAERWHRLSTMHKVKGEIVMIESTEKMLLYLLEEDVDSVLLREHSTFDELVAPFENNFILFGTGGLGIRTLQGLRKLGIEPLAFSDNNRARWHTTVDGVEVLPPLDAVKYYGQQAVFIVTIWSDTLGHPLGEIAKQLTSYGQAKVISFAHLYWRYPDAFLPYFSLDLPHKTIEQADQICKCYHLWADEASRQEYLAQIRWRLWLDFKGLPKPVTSSQYFPDDLFQLSSNEVFVDCGAFDGDSIRMFLAHARSSFNHIVAFEPEPQNFAKLETYIKGLDHTIAEKISVRQAAASNLVGKVRFTADSTIQSSCDKQGNAEVDSTTLDTELTVAPTYIKMDIEGAEPDLLTGAQTTIATNTPILAISIYHHFDHLWQLPLYVQTLSENYRFYLRPHCHTCWELVCYAIPVDRVLAV